MKFVLFCHSLISDWNHGNAHFLRGIAAELKFSGHVVEIYEQADGWSLTNLVSDEGNQHRVQFQETYPNLRSRFYRPETIQLDRILDDADVVIVHEWNAPEMVAAIGSHHRKHNGYVLLFHDTHHRCVSAKEDFQRYDLQHYDGVLAFGEIIRQIYLHNGWVSQAWTWHEAADTRVFRPLAADPERAEDDLVWIGNWGDEERSEELRDYLINPVEKLGIRASVHGVRYPPAALNQLASAGIEYRGWLANYRVPQAFAASTFTVHIPRRPYRELLEGVPTIRVFEALACGIPLICLAWQDTEHLFRTGKDFLQVNNPKQMIDAMRLVLSDTELRESLISHGLHTVLKHHTCAHRVDELLGIVKQLKGSQPAEKSRTYPPAVSRQR